MTDLKINYRLIAKTFLCSFIWGIVAHGYMLFNKFTWNDDTVSTFGAGCTFELGRWALEIVRRAEYYLYEGSISMPSYNGLGVFACCAIATLMLMDLLEIKNNRAIIFITGVLITGPTIMGFFEYMFTALFYMIGFDIMMLGIYIFFKKKNVLTFIIGGLLISFATGVYQAWFSFAAGLIVLLLIVQFIKNEKSWKDYWKWCLANLAMLGITLIIYLLMNKYYLAKYDLQMIDHANMDSFGMVPPIEYVKRIGLAFKMFFRPERGMYPSFISKIYKLMLLVSMITIGVCIKQSSKKISNLLQVLLLLIIFPVATCSIYILAGEAYRLTLYGYVLAYILFIWGIENINVDKKIYIVLKKSSIILLAFMLFWFTRQDNATWMKAGMVQSRANTYFTNLIGRIQSVEGYKEDLPIAYVGLYEKSLETVEDTFELSQYPTPGTYIEFYSWQDFMRLYGGFNQARLQEAEVEKIVADSEYIQNMPVYPNDGSIEVINEVIVVKFSNE